MYSRTVSFSPSVRIALKDVLGVSLFVLLLALSSWVRVYLPFSPIPVTAQTFVLFLSVIFLKQRSLYSVLSYVFLGAAGVPFFSMGAGLAYLLGPTGGYLIGFVCAVLFLGKVYKRGESLGRNIFCFACANVIILAMGMLWLSLVIGYDFRHAFSLGVIPFIYGDVLKITLAGLIATAADSSLFKK